MPRKSIRKETIFYLKNVNVEGILSNQYGSQLENTRDDIVHETQIDVEDDGVRLTDILHERDRKSRRCVTFLDACKNPLKLWVNMIDLTQVGALPRITRKPCWWCRNTFTSQPLGCPIRYNPEATTPLDIERITQKFVEANLPTDQGTDFFETEGLFCTFSCVKAYILDEISRTKSNKYKEALTLLSLLYFKVFKSNDDIPVAGSWRLLTDFGGHLTPEEYRASCGLVEYIETPNIRRPLMYASSFYVQEKRVKL